MDYDNPELQLAYEFAHHTDCHIFLTGKAGTGKTTFLHNLKKNTPKRLAVTAPTGVAAINAGGVTLHSFFQLPFGPCLPGTDPLARENHRLRKEKKDIIASLDMLVIDEISMVRADLLDLIDLALRRYRRSDLPFGGVQLLMIGDLHQLPPVVKESEWQLLRPHYDSPYFFSSLALRQTEMVTVELTHIYRQSDPGFIELLNQVRSNRLDASTLQRLNERHIPDFTPDEADGYITLSTHNQSADTINSARLAELPGQIRHFEAELDGDFPEHLYPTAAGLQLKKGAQVMFVKNDPSPEKRYFNGKIGKIVAMDDDSVEVLCPGESESIEVEQSTWENIEYRVDPENGEISQHTIGTFGQFPLRLAWSITIHKSQGLTFDKAVIDAQAAFAHGQVYVALSRCRTLEGLVLSSPLTAAAIRTDQAVNRFVQSSAQPPTRERLEFARIRYQQRLLLDCFSLRPLGGMLGRLTSLVDRHEQVLELAGADDLEQTRQRVTKEICQVGDNFQRQLHTLFRQDLAPADDPAIQERLASAAGYYRQKFSELLLPVAEELVIETDNKEIRKQLNRSLERLREETAVKLAAITSCGDTFSPERFLRAISTAQLAVPARRAPKPEPVYTEKDVGHPALFDTLKRWRNDRAATTNVQRYQVLHQKTLVQIAVRLPESISSLSKIHGIGKKKIADYGEELVRLVQDYRREHGITEVSLPEPVQQDAPSTPAGKEKSEAAPEVQVDTKEATLLLFQEGQSIDEIARSRGLTVATIENHLAYHIEKGTIAVQPLVDDETLRLVTEIAGRKPDQTMREIRESADNAVDWREIRFVLAHLRHGGG